MRRPLGNIASDLNVDCPVVVLNTHYSGVAIGRDLGRLGVRVIGLSSLEKSPGRGSRWIEFRLAPDSFSQESELRTFLMRLADELTVRAILLPTRDHDINFMSRHRAELEERFVIPLISPDALDQVMNKEVLAHTARRAGLNVPATIIVHRPSELESARSLRFPCVCKPVYASQWRQAGIWESVGRQKALRVESYGALEAFYEGFAHLDPLITVQEWISGGDSSLLIFGSHCSPTHEVAAFFTARKRLQYPPLAGTGIVVEAVLLPELEEQSRDLLRVLQFRGISEIEYKRDDRDGTLYLIEVNPRHWDQHGLGSSVGVNLSEALYRDATGQSQRPMRQSGERKLWIAEIEYARHLARCLIGRAPWRDALVGLGAPRVGATLEWGDLGPFISNLIH